MELNEQFELAFAKSKNLKERPSNEILLQLYSLYKQGSEGDAPATMEYAIFDFVGKAKHEAWLKYSGTTKENAMKQYVELVEQLSQ